MNPESSEYEAGMPTTRRCSLVPPPLQDFASRKMRTQLVLIVSPRTGVDVNFSVTSGRQTEVVSLCCVILRLRSVPRRFPIRICQENRPSYLFYGPLKMQLYPSDFGASLIDPK